MSRSYKHTPRSGDTKNRCMKRYANRKYRRDKNYDETLQHKQYRKHFCSYDICDYETVGLTFEEYWKQRIRFWCKYFKWLGEPFPEEEKERQNYEKWYRRK